jgi:Putative zinc-binding metallo-peptidase
VLNELARSMGQHDFYPFVMSRPVLRKMHFIQMVVKEARGGTSLIGYKDGCKVRPTAIFNNLTSQVEWDQRFTGDSVIPAIHVPSGLSER